MIIGEDTEDHQNDVVWLYSFDVSIHAPALLACYDPSGAVTYDLKPWLCLVAMLITSALVSMSVDKWGLCIQGNSTSIEALVLIALVLCRQESCGACRPLRMDQRPHLLTGMFCAAYAMDSLSPCCSASLMTVVLH